MPASPWREAGATNAIELPPEDLKRRFQTRTVLPSAETAGISVWGLMAPGRVFPRKIDGRQALPAKPLAQLIDLAAQADNIEPLEAARPNSSTIRYGTFA
ncbi:MAG: hypothetical protein IT515_01335 [Burkholderiales bacterium]|nr:hypothetical protein [Burkholderiales bacterium]